MSTPPPCNTAHVRRALSVWAAHHLRGFPWREDGTSVYEVLIAEVLLKRTTARAAARVFVDFTVRFPDLQSIVMAPLECLEDILGPVGLYRQRAKGLKEMARYLVEEHSGHIPDTLSGLLEVPHLGPYSARAVLSFGLDSPVAIVDTNVIRVLGRLYKHRLGEKPSVPTVQALADALLNHENHRVFNWAWLDLGAMVCRYDIPRCQLCPLSDVCDYFRDTQAVRE